MGPLDPHFFFWMVIFMKKVLIATPCLNQTVNAYYVDSLCNSIKLGLKNNINIIPTFLANESILPMARNELFYVAHTQQYDDMVFIDADEFWEAKYLIEILQSPKDVITIPVVDKNDKEQQFNIWTTQDKIIDPEDGYIKAKATGTGFLKLSKKVIDDLWESNIEMVFRQRKLKMICDYDYRGNGFIGEDIVLSEKIIELGYNIWINPHHTVSHIGLKTFTGDFAKTNNLL